MRKCVCSTITAALLFSAGAFAQEFRATSNGQVTDPTGSGVPSAKVTATNTATNEKAQATTGSDGNYTIPFPNPGKYDISAEAPGFKTSIRNGIELQVNAKVTVDFAMEVGAVSENVTVTAAAPLLDEATASRGGVIENLRVTELPLNGRNPFMLSNLTPGVVFAGNPVFTRPFDNGDNANFAINGGLRQTNEFLLDGVPDNALTDTAGDRTRANENIAYIPTVDSTQEFQIMTNFYDAQYGRTGGGVINVMTRTGANAFHGTAYEFLRRYQLDANSFSNNAGGFPRCAKDPVTLSQAEQRQPGRGFQQLQHRIQSKLRPFPQLDRPRRSELDPERAHVFPLRAQPPQPSGQRLPEFHRPRSGCAGSAHPVERQRGDRLGHDSESVHDSEPARRPDALHRGGAPPAGIWL